MSHDATNWAIKAAKGLGLSANSKLVLWHLADSFNPTFGCFQKQDYIAEQTEISRATLNRCLDELEAKQLIARERRVDKASGQQLSTRYRLACEKGFVPQAVVSRVSDCDTAQAPADGEKPGGQTVENPVSHEADRVSETPVAVSHSLETLTSKEPFNPLPPETSPGFAEIAGAWGEVDDADAPRAARAYQRLSADEQRTALALVPAYRQGCYALKRPLPSLSVYLRSRLFIEFENAPPIEGSGFKVSKGSLEYAEWRKHYRQRSPVVFTGMDKQGYLVVPTRWPPEHVFAESPKAEEIA